MVVHYLRTLPGKTAEFMALQRGHYLLATEDRIKEGGMASWAITSIKYPEHRDNPYTHISIGGYESLAQMEKQMPQAYQEKWSSKARETEGKLPGVRVRAKGEMWHLVVEADAPPAKPTS